MSKTMKAIIKPEQAPGLAMAEVPVPKIGPHEALIKVRATSICGTDLHIYKWDEWARKRIRPPLVVGHEFCGHVAAVGRDVTEVKEGDFVSAESHITCGHCAQCRTGNGHICQNTRIIGVDRDGCWAEYIAMPAYNLWPNPPDMAPEIASMLENFGNAVHTAFATDLTAKKVLITGCGPVGLMTVAVAKASGASAAPALRCSAQAETGGARSAASTCQSRVGAAGTASTGVEGTQTPATSATASTTRVWVATSTFGTSRSATQVPKAGSAPSREARSTTGARQRRLAKRSSLFPQAHSAGSMSPLVTNGRSRSPPVASCTWSTNP